MSIRSTHLFLSRGFTLIELVVAIAILAIISAIAIPSLTSVIQNNYSITLSNDMLRSLSYARSEAIRQNTSVSICAASDQTFSACGANWANGWMIFLDSAGTGSFSSANLLRTYLPSGTNAVITTSPSVNYVTYNSAGFAGTTTTNVTFTISATGCTSTNKRTIQISMTGRPTVNSASCP